MMNHKLVLSLFILSSPAYSDTFTNLGLGFPSPPPVYETLSSGKQVADARVDFSPTDVFINETNGYVVTDPFGNTFVVDNIDDPTYAFYGNYVETSDNLTVFDTPEINSTVYVEEINFGNF